mmetsp:Transcript_9273/g.28661  ORF Transcript_9273/g.28661 Transcript_9273/m.28661 type:complete len:218 (-) Transcript_9273:1093-1746(-)
MIGASSINQDQLLVMAADKAVRSGNHHDHNVCIVSLLVGISERVEIRDTVSITSAQYPHLEVECMSASLEFDQFVFDADTAQVEVAIHEGEEPVSPDDDTSPHSTQCSGQDHILQRDPLTRGIREFFQAHFAWIGCLRGLDQAEGETQLPSKNINGVASLHHDLVVASKRFSTVDHHLNVVAGREISKVCAAQLDVSILVHQVLVGGFREWELQKMM